MTPSNVTCSCHDMAEKIAHLALNNFRELWFLYRLVNGFLLYLVTGQISFCKKFEPVLCLKHICGLSVHSSLYSIIFADIFKIVLDHYITLPYHSCSICFDMWKSCIHTNVNDSINMISFCTGQQVVLTNYQFLPICSFHMDEQNSLCSLFFYLVNKMLPWQLSYKHSYETLCIDLKLTRWWELLLGDNYLLTNRKQHS